MLPDVLRQLPLSPVMDLLRLEWLTTAANPVAILALWMVLGTLTVRPWEPRR